MDKCSCCGNNCFDIVATKDNIRFDCFGKDKKIVRCKQCGLVQLKPFWTAKELDELYDNYWKQKDFKGQKINKRISKHLFEYIDDNTNNILEVGCGLGDNIKYLIESGYVNSIGIDKDSNVCDGTCVINKDIFEFENQVLKFDFIYAVHVLEHMADTYGFINKLLSLLNRKGKIVLEIPNVEDPLISIYNIIEFEKFYWYPYHSFFYSPKTIKKILKTYELGYSFEINLRQEYGIINHLRWLIFKKPGNINWHIPIIDDIYKWLLINVFKKTDSIVIVMRRKD